MAERGIGPEENSTNLNWSFKGKNYVFAIGINHYEFWNPLNNAVKDINDFISIIRQNYQFDDANITCLFDRDATEDNILQQLESYVDVITPKDNLIIYFSGHGHYNEKLNEGYWVPVDAKKNSPGSYISNSVLVQYLSSIKSHHTFLIVDSCFSGSLMSQLRSEVRSEQFPSRRILASGRSEVVEDGQPGTNSPFANGIINYLKRNTDKVIKATTLIEFVKDYMERQKTTQTPVDGRITRLGDEGGEFVFHLKRSEEDIWNLISSENKLSGYERYVENYPDGRYADEAREKIHELKEDDIWESARRRNRYESYRQYLEEYPRGKYRKEAFAGIERLEELTVWDSASDRDTLSGYLEYLAKYPNGKFAAEAEKRKAKIEDQLIETENETAARKKEFEENLRKEAEKSSQESDFRTLLERAEESFALKDFSRAKEHYREAISKYKNGFEPDLNFLQKRLQESEKLGSFLNLFAEGKQAFDKGNFQLALHFFEKAAAIHKNQKLVSLIEETRAKLKGGQWSAPGPNVQKKGSYTWLYILSGAAVFAIFVIVAIYLNSNSDGGTTYDPYPTDTTYIDPTPPSHEPQSDPRQETRREPTRSLTFAEAIVGDWYFVASESDNPYMNAITDLFANALVGNSVYSFDGYGNCSVNGVNTFQYYVEGNQINLAGTACVIDKLTDRELIIRTPKYEGGVSYNIYEKFERVE